MTLTLHDNDLFAQHIPLPALPRRVVRRLSGGGMNKVASVFNPSAAPNGCLVAYRAEASPPQTFSRICLRKSGVNIPLDLGAEGLEDPRLFRIGAQDYLVYGDGRRLYLAQLDVDGIPIWHAPIEVDFSLRTIEKNWVPFVDVSGQAWLVYEIAPHTILRLTIDDREGEARASTAFERYVPSTFPWSYGTPRGGAPPVLHEGVFWHFFHSHTEEEGGRRRYHIGVYTFAPEPPFDIRTIGTTPVATAPDNPDGGWSVLFPGSAHRTEDGWVLWCGVHDRHVGHVVLSDSEVRLTGA